MWVPAASRAVERTGDMQLQAEAVPGSSPIVQPRREFRSDPALIQACLDGDESAWNELVERYGRLVYSIPRRYGFAANDADDVFQNVFTILLNRLHSLRDHTRLSAWLITTTHRECWRMGRRKRDDAELEETIEDSGTSLVEVVQRGEQQEIVRQALSELDPRCQYLLNALYPDAAGATYEEIAEKLGLAIGSIGPTRIRCLKKLEGILIAMGIDSVL